MTCQYWYINHEEKGSPIVHCNNEDAKYLTCDYIDAIVCEKCRCRCYSKVILTDEQIQEILQRQGMK
jgi:hypothetical protein